MDLASQSGGNNFESRLAGTPMSDRVGAVLGGFVMNTPRDVIVDYVKGEWAKKYNVSEDTEIYAPYKLGSICTLKAKSAASNWALIKVVNASGANRTVFFQDPHTRTEHTLWLTVEKTWAERLF